MESTPNQVVWVPAVGELYYGLNWKTPRGGWI